MLYENTISLTPVYNPLLLPLLLKAEATKGTAKCDSKVPSRCCNNASCLGLVWLWIPVSFTFASFCWVFIVVVVFFLLLFFVCFFRGGGGVFVLFCFAVIGFLLFFFCFVLFCFVLSGLFTAIFTRTPLSSLSDHLRCVQGWLTPYVN